MADGWVVVLVQLLRCVWLFVTPWTAAFQASLSFTVSWSLLKFMSIESVKLSNHLIFCCLLLFPSIFPSSGSFPMTQLFTLGGQSIRVSASVLPKNIQSWFPLGVTDLISLQSKRLSRIFSSTTIQKYGFFLGSAFYSPTVTSISDYCQNHILAKWCLCFLIH